MYPAEFCTENLSSNTLILIAIFNFHNPSGRTMALGLTQPLTEISTRNIGTWDWQPYHFHVPRVMKSGSLNVLEPSGPVQTCTEIAVPLPLPYINSSLLQAVQHRV